MAGSFDANSTRRPGGRVGLIGARLTAFLRARRDKRRVAEIEKVLAASDAASAVREIRRLLDEGDLGADALGNLLAICLQLDADPEAERVARALDEAPHKSAVARLALAEFFFGSRKHDRARECALSVLEQQPAHVSALTVLADVAKATMRFEDEIQLRRRLLAMRATASAHIALGEALASNGATDLAADAFEAALGVNPFNYAAFSRLERLDSPRAEIHANPPEERDHLDLLKFRARVLSGRGDTLGALETLDRAGGVRQHRDERLAMMRAELLHRICRFSDAQTAYREIIETSPFSDRAVAGLVDLMCDLEDYEGASALLTERAYVFTSRTGRRRRFQAERTLIARQGQFGAFWASYRADHATVALRRFADQVRYEPNIEVISSASDVLFCASWGVGDEIAWSTVYREISARFERPSVTCDPRLYGLLARSHPEIAFIPSKRVSKKSLSGAQFASFRELPDQIFSRILDNSGWRAATSATAVAMVTDALAAFRKSANDFPCVSGALRADGSLRGGWRERLAALGPGMKVGISWRSGNRNARRDVHYTSLEDWGPIFSVEGVILINLQYAGADTEIAKAQASGARIVSFPDLDLQDDFESTAALISELDLVLAPCTAVAELAGAVGASTIMMANSPAMLTRTRDGVRDIWYGNMRHVFGARRFDKVSLIESTAAELRREVDRRSARA